MMKKIICFLLILIPILSSCSADRIGTSKQITIKSDLVLIDAYNYYLCDVDVATKDVKIIQKISSPKNKMELGYLNNFTFDDENRYYLKTQTNQKLETFLQTISKENLEINSIKLVNDFYSNYVYNEKTYAVSSFANNTAYIIMDVYNNDLSLLYTKKFEYDAALMFPSGLVVDEEKIYLVCGFVEKEADYGEVKVYLFEFDLDFNLINSTDLKLDDGGYQAVAKVGDILYLAKTTQGLDRDGYALGSMYIDKYDLNAKEMTYNSIKLEHNYPVKIKYDNKNENLIIQHEKNSLGKNCYSIYNLKDSTLDTILFDKEVFGDYYIYYIQKDDEYYFQTPKGLGVYDVVDKTFFEYNLEELNLNLLNGVFFLN